MKRSFVQISEILDEKVLPWPVRFLTSRMVIILTLALLIPLILFNTQQWFVLLVNSYLNVMSVAVSSIVLLLTKIADEKRERIALQQEQQNRDIAERQERQRKMIADQQERRATEDHRRILEMHQTLFQEIETFKKLLMHVEQIRPELEGMRQVIDNIQTRQAALENQVRSMVDEVGDVVEEAIEEALQEASEGAVSSNGQNGNGKSLSSTNAEI